MRVAAIVVNWNAADQIGDCVEALLAQRDVDLEVVVVDNASVDGSRSVLERFGGDIRVLWNTTNRGFAGAVNDGLAATDAPVVLVANPDVVARPDYVATAVAALEADPRRGAVQGKLLRTQAAPDGRPIIDTTGHVAFRTRLFRNRGEGQVDVGQWDHPGEVFGVSGALAVYRREMLSDIAIPVRGVPEVFDETLFAFWEDVDVDWRAAMRGWSVWYEPRAVAVHERGGAGPRRTRKVEQLNFVNRLLTLIKCDAPDRVLRHLPGFVVTTVLKAGELAITHPGAFLGAFGAVRHVPTMLAKRRAVHARATTPSREVVDRWFQPFDYGGWVRTWYRRVRGIPHGA